MYCFPVDFLQEAIRMSMVSGDKPSLCSCSRTSGILVALGFCQAGVVSRVSRVDVGGVWLAGGLSAAPRTSAWLGGTKLGSASSAIRESPMLGLPALAGGMH